jgi:hypothetical protein
MASTLTIPLVTLPVGPLTFGPSPAADSETTLTLTIDRTVTGGLNALTAITTIDIAVYQSGDGGATWSQAGGIGVAGGLYTDRHGVTFTASTMTLKLAPGTSRQLKATVAVAGTAVAVAGTLISS